MNAGVRLAILLIFFVPAAAAQDSLDEAFDRDVLIIVTSNRACLRFDVYLALSWEQKRRGLMFVRDLPETAGMLFVYDRDEPQSMWMKNTYIPLDIVFARSDGSIAAIVRNTEPQSLASIGSGEPARYVLELNAGATDRFGIDTGSRLLWGPADYQERIEGDAQ